KICCTVEQQLQDSHCWINNFRTDSIELTVSGRAVLNYNFRTYSVELTISG
ncbi:unnamed protein product, partial [Candidula unifasciata]